MNRLQNETSPYLLQHKDNPVDWYPWGEEAFRAAAEQDKPILLSVGYSACHWCHVMAHESFEHGPTAALMNELFINIKVDREERPDIDDIYMQAVQAFNRGGGGWPMTVFLLPDARPFFAGTYYPREPRYGMPSFQQVLRAVHEAYRTRRADLEAQAAELTAALDRSVLNIRASDDDLNAALLQRAAEGLAANMDEINGGFGGAPKFPNPMNLEYLLRYAQRAKDPEKLALVDLTLHKMAYGGIYDQVGGGFHRYAVDAIWLVPHFEKMLYDNAQLSRLYLHAWLATGEPLYRRVADEIYDYILREMTAPEGGFYSATDADSEGEEGKFFVWTIDEVKEALVPLADELPNAAEIAIDYYGMTRSGNFEGRNILHVPNEPMAVAERFGLTLPELEAALRRINDRLYSARTQRTAPGLDDKILTAWNGMMLASLAEAARCLPNDAYRTAAERAGDFLLETMMQPDGRLYRTYKDGRARINAVLEDYAHLIDGFLELYQLTYLEKWFKAARLLADFVLAHFSAEDGAGFFDTSDDHEALIVRPRSLQDTATPAGNTMMAKQLLRLFALTMDACYEDAARRALRPLVPAMQQYPQAFGEALNAADLLVHGIAEVAVIGNPTHPSTRELLRVLHQAYRPNMITALARQPVSAADAVVPLLADRPMRDGQPTVYVCRRFVCAQPVTDPAALETLLQE
jgi:uncharacterized protein YyaL (SSP411 family)